MDPTPPPPPPTHTSYSSADAAAAAIAARSPRGSMSSALLPGSSAAHYSQSSRQRRSSLYPPPLPNRIASRISATSGYSSGSSPSSLLPQQAPPPPSLAAGGGSRRRSRSTSLFEELCLQRRTSAEFCARLDAIEWDHRNSRTTLPARQQQLHRQTRPSSPATSSGLPQMPGGSFSRYGYGSSSSQQLTRPSMTTSGLPPLPRRGFSGYTLSTSSATSSLPDLPGGNVSGYAAALLGTQRARSSPAAPGRLDLLNGNISGGYAPRFSLGATSGQTDLSGGSFSSYSSPLSTQQHAWPSSTPSRLPDIPGGRLFGNTSSSSPQAGSSSSGLPPLPGSFSTIGQSSPPVASDHHQQPWNSGKTTIGAGSSSSSWSVNPPPSCSSTTSRTGFVQRPSSPEQYELPPLPPSLQMPHLPVGQETVVDSLPLLPAVGQETVVDSLPLLPASQETVHSSDRVESTDDDVLLRLFALFQSDPNLRNLPLVEPSSSGDMQLGGDADELISSWDANGSSGHSWSPMPQGVVSASGMTSIDGSSSGVGGGGSMASNCESPMPMSQQQQVPCHNNGTFASYSSHLSPQWQPSPKSDVTPGLVQPTSAYELPPLPPSLDDMVILPVGNSTWNAASTGSSDQNWGAMQGITSNCDAIGGSNSSGLGIMTEQYHSSSAMESSTAMPQLRLGGSESQRVLLPSPSPVDGARSSMSRSGANANLLTDTELEIIMKEKHLQDLVNCNPKRFKRSSIHEGYAEDYVGGSGLHVEGSTTGTAETSRGYQDAAGNKAKDGDKDGEENEGQD